MRMLGLFFVTCLAGSSYAIANDFSNGREFNFGSSDVVNNCENVRSFVGSRVKSFEEKEGISPNGISFVVARVLRHKTGVKGNHPVCVGVFEIASAGIELRLREDAEHYGEDRDSRCLDDNQSALGDVSVVGTRTNWNQGWFFNPFCQSFELFIGKIQ